MNSPTNNGGLGLSEINLPLGALTLVDIRIVWCFSFSTCVPVAKVLSFPFFVLPFPLTLHCQLSFQFPVFPRLAFNSLQQKASLCCKHVGGESDSSSAVNLRKIERKQNNTTELHDYSTQEKGKSGEPRMKPYMLDSQVWRHKVILIIRIFNF